MASFRLNANPTELAEQIVLRAYNASDKHHRSAHRMIQYVLHLAEERGYRQSAQFQQHFQQQAKSDSPTTRRVLFQLFEFVSPEELVEFAGRMRL